MICLQFISSVPITPVDPFTWTSKGRTTSSNLHSAALYRYGM